VEFAMIPTPFPTVATELAMIPMQLPAVVRQGGRIVMSVVVPPLPAVTPQFAMVHPVLMPVPPELTMVSPKLGGWSRNLGRHRGGQREREHQPRAEDPGGRSNRRQASHTILSMRYA
jgi:hypothetical protein